MKKSALYNIFKKLSQNNIDVITTYSAVMRDLRKNYPKKLKPFMEAFKKAFDEASNEKLEDVENVALLEAMQAVDYESY